MISKFSVVLIVSLTFSVFAASDQTVSRLLEQAKSEEAAGNKDVAFLLLRQIVRQYKDSPYVEEALFLVGQYYYDSHNYFAADKTFRDHLGRFPKSQYRKRIDEYLARIHLRSLRERADALFDEGKLAPASVLYEQYLKIDSENPDVKERLAQITKTLKQVHFSFEQLEKERKELGFEKADLKRRIELLEEQRKQVLALQKRAEELNQSTVEKYEKQLADVNGVVDELEREVARLEDLVKKWRQRAVIQEAAKLSQPLPGQFKPTLESRFLPRIMVEGASRNHPLEAGEVEVSGILGEAFPAVVLTASRLDTQNNVRHIEAIVSAELTSPWPAGAKLKVRVDFTGKEDQPEPDPKFVVRYYDEFDMDDIDDAKRAYRKRVVFTAEEDRIAGYAIDAYFVKTQ